MRYLIPMRYLIVGCALLAGCSGSPTAPSAPVAVATFDPNALRWDLVAPGCIVAKPVPMLAGVTPDTRTDTPAMVTAVYGPPSAVIATFTRVNQTWALCSWAAIQRGPDRP